MCACPPGFTAFSGSWVCFDQGIVHYLTSGVLPSTSPSPSAVTSPALAPATVRVSTSSSGVPAYAVAVGGVALAAVALLAVVVVLQGRRISKQQEMLARCLTVSNSQAKLVGVEGSGSMFPSHSGGDSRAFVVSNPLAASNGNGSGGSPLGPSGEPLSTGAVAAHAHANFAKRRHGQSPSAVRGLGSGPRKTTSRSPAGAISKEDAHDAEGPGPMGAL